MSAIPDQADSIPVDVDSVEKLMAWLSGLDPATIDSKGPFEKLDESRSQSPIHALLIGINSYAHTGTQWGDLGNAVEDAKGMRDLLKEYLNVPEGNINLLIEDKATRSDIMKAIEKLGDDNNGIDKGDPILIFYAGHGSQTGAPEGWPAGGKGATIQMLVPYGALYVDETDGAGRMQGIVDIKLANMLSILAEKKGNNITVIFDCCRSGSGTRGPAEDDDDSDDLEDNDGELIREVKVPEGYEVDLPDPSTLPPLPSAGDRGIDILDGFHLYGMGSHVLLAACRHDEKAGDGIGHGRFTGALLDILKKPDAFNSLSYRDVVERIPDISRRRKPQHPQCEGEGKDNTLFMGKTTPRKRWFRVVANPYAVRDEAPFILEAGELKSITPGTIFTVYSDSVEDGDHLLGTVEVKSTGAFQSKLVLHGDKSFTLEKDMIGYGLKTKAGQTDSVSVFMPLDNRLLGAWRKMQDELTSDTYKNDVTIKFVDPHEQDNAEVIVSITDNDKVQFSVISMGVGPTERLILFQTVSLDDPDRIHQVLIGAARFFFYLNLTKNDLHMQERKLVSLSCRRVISTEAPLSGQEAPLASKYYKKPVGIDYVANNRSITVYSKHKEKLVPYGLQFDNWLTKSNLFASVFYFDFETLQISEVYSASVSNISKQAEESLKKAVYDKVKDELTPGYLAIGYGESGLAPRTFTISNDDQDVSYGILKVFVTSESVDLSYMEQGDPFTSDIDKSRGAEDELEGWETLVYLTTIKREIPEEHLQANS